MKEMTDTKIEEYNFRNIKFEVSENHPLGRYGRMRRAYLREYHELTYNHMCLTGELFPHLLEVQDAATVRMERMMQNLLSGKEPGTGQSGRSNGLGAAHEYASGTGRRNCADGAGQLLTAIHLCDN